MWWVMLLVSWSRGARSALLTQAEVNSWVDEIFQFGTQITPANSIARVFTFKERAIPVLRGDTELDTIVAAAELGQGRVVATSEKYLFFDFTKYDLGCKLDGVGSQYKGKHSTTATGKTCQKWTDQTPHASEYTTADQFPDATMEEVSNYCRNPNDNQYGPWCYTMDPNKRMEWCTQIHKCPENDVLQRKNFQHGVKKWLAKGDYKGPHTVCLIQDPSDISCLDDPAVEIVVKVHDSAGPAVPEAEQKLTDWIKQGHGFAFGYRPWWNHVAPRDILFYNVIVEAGIAMNSDSASSHDGGRVYDAAVKQNTLLSLNLPIFAAQSLTSIASLDNPGDYIAFIVDSFICDMNSFLTTMDMRKEAASHFVSLIDSVEGSMQWPPCDGVNSVYPAASNGIIRIFRLYAALGFLGLWKTKKAPNIDLCPGDLLDPDAERVDTEVEIYSTKNQFYGTGHYLAAGDEMTVEVLSTDNTTYSDFSVYVGMHTDDLTKVSPWKRYPIIHARIRLTSTSFKVNTPFGGLVTFKCNSWEPPMYLRARLSGVVKAAHYNLSDEKSRQEWHKNRHDPAPWGELEGEIMTFYMPKKNLIVLDDPSAELAAWDETVRRSYELAGRLHSRRYRMSVITDMQISLGYMHSGNPIMDTKPTYMDHTHVQFPMNMTIPPEVNNKYWGYFHEIGHNVQQSEWTFDQYGEVTVDIFSMFSTEFTNKKHPWEVLWLRNKISDETIVESINTKTYLAGHTIVHVMIYTQIVSEFGWLCLREIFEGYEYDQVHNPSQFPGKGNIERLDNWSLRLSLQVGYNMCPLFDLWAYPLTVCSGPPDGLESMDDEDLIAQFHKRNLVPFLPTDHITTLTGIEAVIAEIEGKYSGIIRELPSKPPCYIPPFERKQQMREELQTTAAALAPLQNIFPHEYAMIEKLHTIRVNLAY